MLTVVALLLILASFAVFAAAVAGLFKPSIFEWFGWAPKRRYAVGVWALSVLLFAAGGVVAPEPPGEAPVVVESEPAAASALSRPPDDPVAESSAAAQTEPAAPPPAPAPPASTQQHRPQPEPAAPVESGPSDNEIRQILISQSIARYSGSCACPYSTDRAGRSCGRRSAYSRPGGASPLCYPGDVTDAAVARYRARR